MIPRDYLFDLATALEDATVNPERIVAAFTKYMDRDGYHVTRALFEQNIAAKLRDPQFNADIGPLLAYGYNWDMEEAARTIVARLTRLLPGAPWKGSSP